ncbi:MAG: RagB/SusD family nutrient uptake outer membrane protein [Mangrovibacterium sp.]
MNTLKISGNSRSILLTVLAILTFTTHSCVKDLLDQQPTTELGTAAFWQMENDATSALMGAYASIRWCYDRDYYFDGHGEYMKVRGISAVSDDLKKGDAYTSGDTWSMYTPSGYGDKFDKMFRYLYGGVSRANYVIGNVQKMLPQANETSRKNLEAIIGEARLLRGMVYFRLISMWGDVPYFGNIIYDNSEVESLSRLPIAQIKDSIMADFTYAVNKLPNTAVAGRTAKPAALAFRGKLQLYWACWNKFGWPELTTFTPSTTEAEAAYKASAADFKSVINDFGLTLFRGGAPGEWGEMGKCDILPNYYDLFLPKNNNNSEVLMSFAHAGFGTDQVEEVMRDLGGRNHEYAQCWVSPYTEIADRYQSTITGDFCPPLIPMNPNNQPGARTVENSMLNPESYRNRDYRMKATMMWDYEKSQGVSPTGQLTGLIPFIYQTQGGTVTIDGVRYDAYLPANPVASNGYVFRKFVRNYAAGQTYGVGNLSWPVMRLADVYLMYAEASNEAYGPQADAIEAVNKVRYRGNLPALAASKTTSKEVFFDAIEQERIVELVGEGHRGFDLRRWRAIERVWCPPYGEGKWRIGAWGQNLTRYFYNSSELVYQRCYIFKIPQSERDRNPNLTQNQPWM